MERSQSLRLKYLVCPFDMGYLRPIYWTPPKSNNLHRIDNLLICDQCNRIFRIRLFEEPPIEIEKNHFGKKCKVLKTI